MYYCDVHGVNTTHTSEDCCNLKTTGKGTTSHQEKKPKASSKRTEHGHKVIAEEEEDGDEDEDKEEAAQLANNTLTLDGKALDASEKAFVAQVT
ncbi:hypothetical protein FRB99_000495 [Tulasnella sp. 403]|nr:hypothetical protein FRB99_000495 [Tulasnella sp. 403]